MFGIHTLHDPTHDRIVDGIPEPGSQEHHRDMSGLPPEDIGVEEGDLHHDRLENQVHREIHHGVAEDLSTRELVIPGLGAGFLPGVVVPGSPGSGAMSLHSHPPWIES